MKKLKILNTREIKEIYKKLKEQFGFDEKLNYAFLQDQKNKIWIVSRELDLIDFEKLRINTIGFYFGEIKFDEIRLSMEGAQLIGPVCSKNILELKESQVREYFKGHSVDVDCSDSFKLLKFGDDFFGCGRVKKNVLINYLPKVHRCNEIIL